jgi:TetR/AcrR family transcriptional regulator
MSTAPARARLPAAERRAALLDTACRMFAKGGYRGTTTAEIAREAGVTEPILYRHFGSKRDLYVACLEQASQRVRSTWERAIEHEPDPAKWLTALGNVFTRLREVKAVLMNLWVQGLAEAADDPEIRRELRRSLHEAHDFLESVIQRVQEAGAIPRDRDPGAEAWIFLATGFFCAASRRLGGVLTEGDFEAIKQSRRNWLTGEAPKSS